MKAVFVHDHKFRRIEGKIYSPGGLPDDVLSRYVEWFGTVTVVGRIMDEDIAKPNYSQIINSEVSVVAGDGLKELIRQADCVIARVPSINGYKAIRYAKIYKKQYLVEVVGCTFDAYWNYGFKGKLFAVPAYLIMRHYVKDAPYALYVTSEFLQKRYPCKGKTIGVSDVSINAVSENTRSSKSNKPLSHEMSFHNKSNRQQDYSTLHELKVNKGNLKIGTLAAIDVAYKGQEYVIKAIPEIEKELGVTIEYELVGGGSVERLYNIAKETGVEEKVTFIGSIPHNEVFSWLDSIDCYIQPSMQEGLSRALVEAMSRGLPCIASNCGGNVELLDDDCIVRLKPIQSYTKRIVKAIVSLYNDGQYIIKGERNYTVAHEKYGSEVLSKLRDSFFKSFVQSCRSNN